MLTTGRELTNVDTTAEVAEQPLESVPITEKLPELDTEIDELTLEFDQT